MLNIVELLHLRGLDTNCKIKLVRHQDKRYDVNLLLMRGQLETYQSYQGKLIFDCKYIVSFIGMEGSKARFLGVYEVKGHKPATEAPLPEEFIYQDFLSTDKESKDGYFYILKKVPGFEDLELRVVINWGNLALAWHQFLTEKEVIEILPGGNVEEFPGYLNVILSYGALKSIFDYPDAYKEWHRKLSVVAGVYLILDTKTGKQYVGSAYGKDGIYGRWAVYAKCPDGGDNRLQELFKENKDYAKNFQFTILHTMPLTYTDKDNQEVINYEYLYMKKLGTIEFGLNSD